MKAPFLFLLAATASYSAAEDLEFHPSATSSMELTVEKTGFLSGKKHLFTFSQYGGTLAFNREAPERSVVSITIQSGSAQCRDTWLSAKDLKKVQEYALKDMLAADRYPELVFRSTTVKRIDSGQFEVQGMLTIRDVSKPVTVAVSQRTGSDGAAFEGTATIRLTDFRLKPPAAALGTIGTKNEMQFRFVVAASKPHAASGAAR